MGTTLQNGVYLPNEGERNCYAGLKTNWEILDQKVADVTALQQAVAGALHRQIVTQLPTEDIDPNTIYMILSGTSATENVYNEYMYVNNAWELIGTSATDLTNYYTKAEVDGKLLLKANASDLTSHTGDTTIHVTTADKTKWNNGVSQSYVLRYSSSSVTDNSTIAYSTLDNIDNIKSGDKVIDSDGKIFSIVSVDTANSTVTVGSALIDLAKDSDVVHKSGNETVGGNKTFSNQINVTAYPSLRLYSKDDSINTTPTIVQQNEIRYTDKNNGIISYFAFQHRTDVNEPFRTCWRQNRLDGTNSYYSVNFNNLGEFYPENNNAIKLGTSIKRWSEVYAQSYYYGSNNVEFSTKFVTTDTAQTISGSKTFSNDLSISNTDTTANTPNLILRNYKADRATTDTAVQTITFLDKNSKALTMLESRRYSNGNTATNILCYNTDDSNNTVSDGITIIKGKNNTSFAPTTDNAVTCGRALAKWSDVQTYKVNALEPSSLSLPSGNANDVIDISSYITALDGTFNSYTVPANGWISIAVTGTAIAIVSSSWSDSRLRASSGNVRMLYPVLKNETVSISIAGTTLAYARFIPCQGNV